MEMLLDLDGLSFILAHLMDSSSLPSRLLVHGAVVVRVVIYWYYQDTRFPCTAHLLGCLMKLLSLLLFCLLP